MNQPAPGAPPPELRAFRQLYHARYLRYALVRLGRHRGAVEAVERTFAELAARWPEVLSAPRPNAVAWRLLSHHLAHHEVAHHEVARHGGDIAATGGPACPVEAMRAEARVLSRSLGLPPAEVADVMGADPAHVTVLLRP
ncbi:hypothetical protein FH609_003635 [Streptomyces sp. 3MP-14]|uniref:Sigma-70 family RNA polymerase sigma factor n=1 Tax=Streptomyces mimosae TaxID=2586635 RepID=A0A5N6A5Z1_9ACTN|nr:MULTISPECIES: hypothetical protein [Streptomyces]KAB8162838.1 hypothetical protein FH607_019500 [Streptomyces mimosae]KAB8179051.1 hypothetical protein FH609_003635 [Streptomyces sp. 3MP-14]